MNFVLTFRARLAAALLASAIFSSPVVAQVGSDNPTGTSGAFNGTVSTGGSYDPYTANATRSITDLDVPGSVGAYPLAFTRMLNSRYLVGGKLEFGPAGTWSHNFQWHIPSQTFQTNAENDPEPVPSVYHVDYPDGRRVAFMYSAQDSAYRAFAGSGIADRFEPLDNPGGGYCYLLLPDGGKIQFTVGVVRQPLPLMQLRSTFTFKFSGIVDPHGLFTSVTYPADGSMTVQEPGGRQLKLFYVFFNGATVLDRVEQRAHEGAPAARSVQYHYVTHAGQTALSSVVYFGKANLTATYTYQDSNVNSAGRPLLSTANDSMYAGPMGAIAYEYATGAGVVHGQILREKHPNGTHVSTLSINGNSRTETRGDGPQRTFNYSNGKLISYTDFQGRLSSISYDTNGFRSAFTDARGKTTTTLREGIIGALSVLTHPDPEHSTQGYTYWSANGGPYHVQIRGDERGKNTYINRDENFRVTRIDYPDYPNGAFEEFTYNAYGQVLTHKKSSGGTGPATHTFTYDARRRLATHVPPVTGSDPNPESHPTCYGYYETGPSVDRLHYVQDPHGNRTWFEYNLRGQITKVTHQDGSFRQMGYNRDRKLEWSADENHPNAATDVNQRTRYTYDDYKRVTSVTNALNQTTSFSYAPWNGTGAYSHTSSTVRVTLSPMSKQTHFDYDPNLRMAIHRAAPGTPDDAWTFYGYDEVGNLTSIQDPRGHVTTFAYDNRNRRISATNPPPFQNEITRWEYDAKSNLIKEIRPDQSFRRMEYDAMDRVIDTYGFANEHTHYGRDLAGNVTQMVDAKDASYGFDYDALNRKTSATYPQDATGATRTETWLFDWAGNLFQYKNPAGRFNTMSYDNRNRLTDSSWNAGATPNITRTYDDASRLIRVASNNNETIVAFTYDAANRLVSEDQTVSGLTHSVQHDRDADGLATNTHIPGLYLLWYTYNQRGQLSQIQDGGGTPWINYSYDVAGNLTKRQAVYGGINDSLNLPSAQYDALNRPLMWENTGSSDNAFARSWQQYDNLGRMTATWRDEQASKGERYDYNPAGPLTKVVHNADNAWTQNPSNWSLKREYNYAPGLLNWQSVNDNGYLAPFANNGLNQYTSINGSTPQYGGNFNLTSLSGLNASYNQKHLVSASQNGNSVQFVYDGLGRCLKRTINGISTIYVHDGWKPILERGGDLSWHAVNIYGPGPDEIVWRYDSRTNAHLRYHHDVQGNVAFLLDWNGAGLEKYTYDAFGNPKITDWSGNDRTESAYKNRFMFRGREYLHELGIYDYRNRFYHPGIGRFLQRDPIGFAGGDANLFRYCGGDPVNCSDPSGLVWGWPTTGLGGLIGGVTGTVGGFIAGTTNQGMSWFNGTGFGWDVVGGYTWRGTLLGTAGGMIAGSLPTFDPSAYAASALMGSVALGALAGTADHAATILSPPAPGTPPVTNQSPDGSMPFDPPVTTLPDGRRFDGNGAELTGNGRSGGGENHISGDSGSTGRFGPFTPGPNSFTTAEGNSIFSGFGPGFRVDLSQQGQNAYFASPTGNPAGGTGGSVVPVPKKKH